MAVAIIAGQADSLPAFVGFCSVGLKNACGDIVQPLMCLVRVLVFFRKVLQVSSFAYVYRLVTDAPLNSLAEQPATVGAVTAVVALARNSSPFKSYARVPYQNFVK